MRDAFVFIEANDNTEAWGMSMHRLIGGLSCIALMLGASVAGAQAQGLKTYPITKSGSWSIETLYNNNVFVSCFARVRYKSGITVSMIAYHSGNWSLQFYRDDWPMREVSTFPATLEVDGRVISRRNATYRGRSVFVPVGTDSERVRALMRGRVMTIRSQSGVSSFRLTGSNRAAQEVARCWTDQRQKAGTGGVAGNNNGAFGNNKGAPNNGGAFGAPPRDNSGAFGGPGSGQQARRPTDRRNVMSRGGTMEYVARYLARSPQRYEILPSSQNVFRNFPVNWRYENGRVGGMMVVAVTVPDAEKGISILLSDQTKLCEGRSATERKPTTGEAGRRVAKASGICEGKNGVSTLDYYAIEFGSNRIALIVEMSKASQDNAERGGGFNPYGSNPLQRIPGPNEL